MDSSKTDKALDVDLQNTRTFTRKKLGKRKFIRKLVEENKQLKEIIAQIIQNITAVETQNQALTKQLSFFQNADSSFVNSNNKQHETCINNEIGAQETQTSINKKFELEKSE